MTENTVRLSLAEAAAQAEAELALSEESGEPDSSSDSEGQEPQGEQLTVETSEDRGLFDSIDDEQGQEDQLPQGESFEVTVDGETFQVDVDELRNGYMRQADYTRKTQELKDKQREADKSLTLMQMLEERPHETLRQLYQRINAGQPLDLGEKTTPPQADQTKSPQDIESLVEQRVAEMLQNDPRLVAIQQERAVAEINGIFSEIEKDYGVTLTDGDKQRVLQEAQAKNTTDLAFVFGGLYSQKLKAERQKELDKRNAQKVSPTSPSGRVDSHPTPAPPKKYDNYRS